MWAVMAFTLTTSAGPLADGQLTASHTDVDAAITGVVVDGVTGQPLGDAVVSLSAAEAGQPRRQQTDSLGRFVYPNLTGGSTYVLTATRFGYLSSEESPSSLTRSTVRVFLAKGQWARGVRVPLWQPAAISGTVTDAYGDPIVGAYVRVLMKTNIGGRDRLAAGAVATTDDLGAYRIGGLTRGTYVVALVSVSESAQSDSTQGALNSLTPSVAAGRPARPRIMGLSLGGGNPSVLLVGRYNADSNPGTVYASQYFAGASNAASATAVTVDYGDERSGVNFALQRVRAWRVSGIVHGPAEDLGSLSLRLVPFGSEGIGIGGESATTRPAPDGRFSFLAVPSGHYTLVAAPATGEFIAGLAPQRTRLPATSGLTVVRVDATSDPIMFGRGQDEGGSSWGQQVVTVDDRDVEALELTVKRGASITGSLVLDTGSVPPANRTGAIVVEPSLDNESLTLPSFKVIEATGTATSWSAPRTFEIRGLPPGNYYLRTNLADAAIKSIVVNGRDVGSGPIDVSSGSDVPSVIVTMTSRVATLSGIVQLAPGDIAAAVLCFPADPAAWTQFALNPVRTRTSLADSNGTFRLSGLPAGDYLVVAIPEAQRQEWRDKKFLEAASRVAARVHLEWGANVNQNLRVETIRSR